jgi:hypothetical protein
VRTRLACRRRRAKADRHSDGAGNHYLLLDGRLVGSFDSKGKMKIYDCHIAPECYEDLADFLMNCKEVHDAKKAEENGPQR